MEYEIEDRPQFGEDHAPGVVPAHHDVDVAPARHREQRDRAVAIPEQEDGS